MKFSAVAVLAAAAGAQAAVYSNVTVTTEVVTAYTTWCPVPTTLTHGDKTYTVTEATTLTITNCPCTITRPVTTVSSVVCKTCNAAPTNNTVPTAAKSTPAGTGAATVTKATTLPTAGAGKVAALSGGALAGVLGLAALVL